MSLSPGAVTKNPLVPSNDRDVEKEVALWLRQTPDRNGGKKLREARKLKKFLEAAAENTD